MTIENYCIEITQLLDSVGEKHWATFFHEILNDFEKYTRKELHDKLLKIYGGMGSFNDLILYKKSELCIMENENLDQLRKELFNALTSSIGAGKSEN